MRERVPWAAVGFLAAGVVVGWVLGGIAPRAALVESEAEVARLSAALAEAAPGPGWRSPVPGLDRILRAPERERVDEGTPLPAARGDQLDDAREATSPVLDGGVAREPAWRERWRDRAPEDRLATFRDAASLQRVRRVQSRAALQQQAELSDEEMVEVDAALSEMNDALLGHGEELLVLAMSDEPPPARDLLGITHDVTGILHRAQVRLEEVVGEERAGDVDASALEIWNHVDLGALEPAARSAIERGR